jgi:hypothetical protein
MSFQGYLDTIKAKTGKGPDDFRALAKAKGLVGPDLKAGQVIAWVKEDFGLGHGHGMAIFSVLKNDGGPRPAPDDKVAKVFGGGKAKWRPLFNQLSSLAQTFGGDVGVSPGNTYVSLVRDGKKFAILQPAAGHLDIGIKRKGVEATRRFAEAGSWNTMVTHRTRITDAGEIDPDLTVWLRAAYEAAA